MNPTSRLEAQQRADEIRAFEVELKRLQEQGVLSLTGEQERAVTDHHATLLAQYERAFDVDRDVKAKQLFAWHAHRLIPRCTGAGRKRLLSVLPILGIALHRDSGWAADCRGARLVLRRDVGAKQGRDRLL